MTMFGVMPSTYVPPSAAWGPVPCVIVESEVLVVDLREWTMRFAGKLYTITVPGYERSEPPAIDTGAAV